jgi:hypothetical protein
MTEKLHMLDAELGTVLRHRGEAEAAVAVLQPMTTIAGLEPELADRTLFELGLSLCYLSRWADAEAVATQLAGVAASSGDPVAGAHRADLVALARMGVGDYDGAVAAADEGIAVYLDSPLQDNAGYLYNVKGMVALARGELADAEAEFVRAEALGAQYGVDRLQGLAATNLAWALVRAARDDDARAAAERGAARLASNAVAAAATGQALAALLASSDRGDATSVRAALDAAVGGSRSNTDIYTPSEEVLSELASRLA